MKQYNSRQKKIKVFEGMGFLNQIRPCLDCKCLNLEIEDFCLWSNHKLFLHSKGFESQRGGFPLWFLFLLFLTQFPSSNESKNFVLIKNNCLWTFNTCIRCRICSQNICSVDDLHVKLRIFNLVYSHCYQLSTTLCGLLQPFCTKNKAFILPFVNLCCLAQ